MSVRKIYIYIFTCFTASSLFAAQNVHCIVFIWIIVFLFITPKMHKCLVLAQSLHSGPAYLDVLGLLDLHPASAWEKLLLFWLVGMLKNKELHYQWLKKKSIPSSVQKSSVQKFIPIFALSWKSFTLLFAPWQSINIKHNAMHDSIHILHCK